MCSIYGILYGTLYIVFIQASFLDQAISFPDDPQALFNAGTELYLQEDFSNAVIFLDRAKKCCSQKFPKNLQARELAENISLNLAHSLVKAEKYQEALAEYKDLYCKFTNPKAEKNIPILEKFLQQEDQKDKQQKDEQDQNQEQDSKNQDAKSDHDQDDDKPKSDKQSENAKNDFDNKNKQKKNQELDKEKDQKKEKQNENRLYKNTNQAQAEKSPHDEVNTKNKKQEKDINQQILDKDEQALLNAIENFDQDMMKMYAAVNCGGNNDVGW